MKKHMATILLTAMAGLVLTGCAGGGEQAGTAGTQADVGSTAAGEITGQPSGEKQVVEFWYCSANETSTPIFEQLFDEYNAASDQYEFKLVGIANKDAPEKLAMAIATNTMPDVFSTGFYSIMQYVTQDAVIPVDSYLEEWEDADKFVPEVLSSLRDIGGGTLYAFPYAYNQDISWYNTEGLKELGIEAPVTQSEFLQLCEEYANPEEGTYFFSLRGNLPYDNLLAWLFTYADGAGYDGSYFDENNQCIINKAEFVEALDAYANIYKNGWVSGSCVTNGFNEMVAEFGAGTAQYIMHNSSSKAQHENNLGEGNFAAAKSLANDKGLYYNSSLQSLLFAVSKKHGDDGDYSGAIEMCKFLTSEKALSSLCQVLGSVPVNTDCYEADWFKNDPFMPLYQEILTDENHRSIQNPYWLPEYSSFLQNDMTADFQAVLLGEMTSKEALDRWAETLTQYQKDYLDQK